MPRATDGLTPAPLQCYYWDSVPNPAASTFYQHRLPSRSSLAAAASLLGKKVGLAKWGTMLPCGILPIKLWYAYFTEN